MVQAPLVIVTRPESEAIAWAKALQVHGIRTHTLPLLQIGALPDASALVAHWHELPAYLAVMFVSANAVRFFMAQRPEGMPIKACRAWSTGPGTRAALLAARWPADQIDSPDEDAPHFDSEALWAKVAPSLAMAKLAPDVAPAKLASVLVVRGADADGQMAGRDWLVQQLQQAGVRVVQTVAYVRQAPVWSDAQKQRALQAMTDGSWWLFSSSEAALHLPQLCPGLPLGQAKALATHPRIAKRLQQSGWGQVETVPAALAAQAESIKSLS